ncbi:MAG: HD domain-containing protein [Carnobacterium sp.]|uniref:HD domain-containing protein n=1 Tax=Carnobacterium sp. TaxID=48221 RepID=UPI002FC90BAE
MEPKWKQDLEYVALIEDLLNREEVQKLNEYTQHHFTTRLEHSISVSYLSYRIAKRYGWDAKATARAGLLHDLFYYDWRTTKFDEGTHAYVHPRMACENAKKLTELSDLECDIIIKHMWLATVALPKYKESYVVTFVDKYCAIKEVAVPLTGKARNRVKSAWARLKPLTIQ